MGQPAEAGEQARRLLLRRLRLLARRRLQRQELRLRPAHGVDRLGPLGLLARQDPLPLQLHPQARAVEDAARQHLRLRAC